MNDLMLLECLRAKFSRLLQDCKAAIQVPRALKIRENFALRGTLTGHQEDRREERGHSKDFLLSGSYPSNC